MINLPDNIKDSICIQAILIKKGQMGWNEIHNFIRSGRLCLKRTQFDNYKNTRFHKIERVVSTVFYDMKPYTWLRGNDIYDQKRYTYDSPILRVNDIYCMNDFGNFFDDDIEYE